MPWYYSGPDSKPVGPVALEDLHARRLDGTVQPDTYIIEYTNQPGEVLTWRRYAEVFPNTALPFQSPPVAATAPHPLFPSASVGPRIHSYIPSGPQPVAPALHATHTNGITNGYCLWGMVLSIASYPLLFVCGLGVFVAPIALILCIVGLVQTSHHPEQKGRVMAVLGLLFSLFIFLLTAVVIAWATSDYMKEETTTEQTTSDT